MTLYEQLGKDVLNEDLDVFNPSFPSYYEAIEAFFKELWGRASIEKLVNDEDGCLLRTLIIKSNFDYPHIESYASLLQNQLIDVTFIAAVCANVSRDIDGGAASITNYTKQFVDDVTLISSYTSKWLNDSLISAWPSAHNEILNEELLQLVQRLGNVNHRRLEIMADLTHPTLINTGIPNYFYEMLFVQAADENNELFFDGIGDHCSLTKNGASGFDTIIGRIPFNFASQLETFDVARKMFPLKEYAKQLNKTIQLEMDNLYGEATLPLIADALKKRIGETFITEQDYHCWTIARWSAYLPCPTINYHSSPHRFVNLGSITTLNYTNSGTFYQHCQEFRFFFFM